MSDSEALRPTLADDAAAAERGPVEAWLRATCVVCGRLLGLRDRKVHQGRCARTRKTQLQKQRRALRRARG